MTEENRPPEDEQPLARPAHEQRLARPVSREREQQEARRTQDERGEAPQAEEREGKGLIDKADELIDEAKKKLTGG